MNVPPRLQRHSPHKASAAPTGGALLLPRASTCSLSRRLERARRVLAWPLLPPMLLWAMMLAYALVMLRLVFYRYDTVQFRTGWDLAIFDQATWLLSQGQTPFVSVRGLHILADHFSIVLYLLTPFYWLWPSPKVLLSAQTLALAAGALPAFALGRERLQSAWWGLLIAGTYLLYPMVQWANSYEFHPDTFAVPMLLGALLYLRRRRWPLYVLCLLGAALTKENAGLTICALGLWAWWRVDRRAGLLTIVGGFACTLAAFLTIRHFNGGAASGYYLLYEKYSSDLPGLALGVLAKPALVWQDASSQMGREYLSHLLAPLMYLPLLSPGTLLPALPSLGTNLLSSRSLMHTLNGGYYSSLAIPFFFAATIESVRWLQSVLGRRTMAIIGANLLAWSIASALQGAAWSQNRDLAPPTATSERLMQQRRNALREVVHRVPDGASVSAQSVLTPYLNHRKALYTFPNPFVQRGWGNTAKARRELEFNGGWNKRPPQLQARADAAPVEFVALCPGEKSFPLPRANFQEITFALFKSRSYAIVAINRHAVLLRRNANRRAGWRLLARAAATPIANEKQMEAALWTWLAQ